MTNDESTSTFHFLDLPPELRNGIYEFALISSERVMLPSACNHKQRCEAVQPPLSRANRQIRQECLPIFYHETKFKYHLHGCDFRYFIDFMDSIGTENCKHLTDIDIVIKNRLSCGKGMHDFARWCAQTHDTDDLAIGCSFREWNVAYSDDMSESAQTEMRENPDAFAAFLGEMQLLIDAALNLGQRLRTEKRTNYLQVHDSWDDLLDTSRFQCDCERPDTSMADNLYVAMDVGHCSDLNRFVKKGVYYGDSETEKDGEETEKDSEETAEDSEETAEDSEETEEDSDGV